MSKRIYRKIDPRTRLCLCGTPAVAEVYRHDFWCQGCIDKAQIVHELHYRQEEIQKRKELEREYADAL